MIRLAGGAVRDLLRGLSPKDLDLATTATPEESKAILLAAHVRVVETGLQHGTVTAVIDGEPFEITTLRIDEQTDGRRAMVVYTDDWHLDAQRRDLTINAMFMDLHGEIHDYFNGAQDLEAHRIRFVGDADERIKEDYLRIMRYFRFHGRIALNNEHEAAQLSAIRANAAGLEQISGERVWMELAKILETTRAPDLLRTMQDCQVLNHIGMTQVTEAHLQELQRVHRVCRHAPTLLATLLDTAADLNALFARWRFSLAEKRHAQFILDHRASDLTLEAAEDLLVDNTPVAHVEGLCLYQEHVDWARHVVAFSIPSFPINGQMLMEVGVPKGRVMGRVIQALRISWKAARFTKSADQLLEEVPAILAEAQS